MENKTKPCSAIKATDCLESFRAYHSTHGCDCNFDFDDCECIQILTMLESLGYVILEGESTTLQTSGFAASVRHFGLAATLTTVVKQAAKFGQEWGVE